MLQMFKSPHTREHKKTESLRHFFRANAILHVCYVKFFHTRTSSVSNTANRGADKSLAQPGREQAAPVKNVTGRGMD